MYYCTKVRKTMYSYIAIRKHVSANKFVFAVIVWDGLAVCLYSLDLFELSCNYLRSFSNIFNFF